MNSGLSSEVSPTAKVVAAALVGVVGGLVGTALVLGSPELGIFGAVGGAVVSMIGALAQVERSEV
jgi:hypothetical protein